MKKKIKKIVSLLLSSALTVTVFTACTASYDENYVIYDLWVGGTKVTSRNQHDILGDGTVSYSGDRQSGVLTLNGANITESSDPDADAVIISAIDQLTLNLVGENYIGMGEKAPVNGFSAFDLTITGDGSITVGARASCIKADIFTVESGRIDTYIKTAEDEVASFIGVGLWAQELLTINGGDIRVNYSSSFSPYSYGLYCVKDLVINDGSICTSPENAMLLAVGLIASENMTVNGGNISVYGFDDAINAKTFAMTGGTADVSSVDIFSDGVCRLVHKADFSGGSMTLTALDKTAPESITLFSTDLTLNGVILKGGDTADSLDKKNPSDYDYTDSCIRIEEVKG